MSLYLLELGSGWLGFKQSLYVKKCKDQYLSQIEKARTQAYIDGGDFLSYRAAQALVDKSSFVNDLYFEGFNIKKTLTLSWQDFENRIKITPTSIRYGHIKPPCPYRDGKKYRKDVSHMPKEPSNKEAWHIETGRSRDKAKHGRHHRKHRKFCVKQDAKNHRAWSKQMIKHEKWDEFSQGDEEHYKDKWAWS